MEEFFEDAIEQNDPVNQVEEQYRWVESERSSMLNKVELYKWY